MEIDAVVSLRRSVFQSRKWNEKFAGTMEKKKILISISKRIGVPSYPISSRARDDGRIDVGSAIAKPIE